MLFLTQLTKNTLNNMYPHVKEGKVKFFFLYCEYHYKLCSKCITFIRKLLLTPFKIILSKTGYIFLMCN